MPVVMLAHLHTVLGLLASLPMRAAASPLVLTGVEAARRGFFRSIGHIILVIVVVLVVLGILLGIGVSRLFRRRR